MKKKLSIILFAIIALYGLFFMNTEREAKQPAAKNNIRFVNIYSSRDESKMYDIYSEFTNETGIQINIISGTSANLLSRIFEEGSFTPADILITNDVGDIALADYYKILVPINSKIIEKNIPEYLYGAGDRWIALSKWIMPVFYNKLLNPDFQISTYKDLANHNFNGKFLLSSSENIANQSFMCSIIGSLGEGPALEWSRDVIKNTNIDEEFKEDELLTGLALEKGAISLARHNYYYKLKYSQRPDEVMAANNIGMIFPDQLNGGVVTNLTAAGLVKYSVRKDDAIKFLEFLTSKKVQEYYANVNYDLPANPEASIPATIAELKNIKLDDRNFQQSVQFYPKAIELMKQAKWR